MTEEKETIARALEIAINLTALTNEKHLMMRMDEDKNVLMQEPLLRNLEMVMRIMKAKNLVNIYNSVESSNGCVYPWK